MKVFVINLKRRPDRLQEITKECEKHSIDFELIEAVDGKVAFPNAPKRIWQPALGCYESHLKALKLIQESGEDGMILEDDCVFVPDFNKKYLEVLKELPSDWDIFFMGGSLLWENAAIDYLPNLKRANNVLCTQSYCISKNAVKGLIEEVEKEKGKIDVIYTNYQKKHKCFIAYPELTYQREGYSDIVESFTNNTHLRYGKKD